MRRFASILGTFLFWWIAAFAMIAASAQAQAQVNGATFVSQSVPASMTAGKTYSVSVTMKNSGTTIWTSASAYKLGSQNPGNNLTWGIGRVALTTSVAPGQQYTFAFNVTAPATAGTYNFQWQMLRESVAWFGAASSNAVIAVNPSAPTGLLPNGSTLPQGATSVTLSWGAVAGAQTYPIRVLDTTPGAVPLQYENTCAGTTNLVCKDNLTTNSYSFPVQTGHSYTWWVHSLASGAWSDESVATFTVPAAPVNGATFVSQSVPASMTAGQSYNVSVTIKNSGTTTWTSASAYKLGSQNPGNNQTWGINRVELATSVAPGQQYTFAFNITAPTTAGTYNFQWKMLRELVEWFGAATPNVAVVVTASSSSQPPISQPPTTATRTSAFEYDPASGLLTKEIIEPGNTQLRVETAYVYDAWGNKTSATVSSPATGTAAIVARASSTTYDTRGQFPVSSTNALGQSETKVIDPKFGTMTSLTGPNGLTTQWQYDSFGRKTLEIRADGTRTKWGYLYCNGVNGGTATCPGLAKYLIQVTPLAADGVTANGPWSKTYFDALEREVRRETLGFDGTSVVAVSTEYDSLGRVYRTSLPYYSGQTPQWTTTAYDVLGRVVATTAPDNTQTSYSYNGLTTSVTNALGQTQTQLKNSQGKTVRTTDAAGSVIAYQYDAFGNMWKTTDPKGNVVTLTYDIRGRKIQMADPDMGSWTYAYNALGELVSQTDAKGQITNMAYDKLGRMTSRSEPDLVSTWAYDNCTKGVGKLCQAQTDNGYISTPSYDSLGRASSTVTTIDAAYTSSVAFDANGRVVTQTYPTGFAVKYVYTSLGYLKEVRNNASNALYWRADTMDAQGHLLQQTYGNNIVTQQVFEATTGRLKNIYAGAGNGVQNLAYDYDAIGNLLSRNDANQNLSETFLYDTLNRITTSTVNSSGAGVVTQTYAYDSIGNITSRSDIGTYIYGAINARPHAITQIALGSGGKRTYAYDANGNLTDEVQYNANNSVISNKGRTEVYTSFNMPQALGAPGISLAFAYGPEHQRVKQIAPGATTIYLHPDNKGGLFYEKDLKADGSTEHKHFITAGGSVVAIVKQAGTSTTATYLHRDSIGSTSAVTNAAGTVIERFAYEPFGKRRPPAGTTDPNNTIVGINTDRGYTNHEHLDELGLIHMNGRIYDPALGRFMSADPYIQAPGNLQSYNRYSYVMNSPFMFTDPSGFSWWTKARDKWIRPIAAIAVAWYLGPAGYYGLTSTGVTSSAFASSLIAGAASGAVSTGSLKGALQGALTAGLFYGAGTLTNGYAAGSMEKIAAHAAAGCISASAAGGNCGSGALSAGFAEGLGGNIKFKSGLEELVGRAVIGGTASVIGGGKFENGAMTGAFGYLFNKCAHDPKGCSFWERVNERYTNTSATINSTIDSVLPGPVNSPEGLASAAGGGLAAKDYGGRTALQEGLKLAKEYKDTSFSLFRTIARPDIVRIGATTAVTALAVNVAWKGGLYVGSTISEVISGPKLGK